jgi:spore maturation protein CgeB
MKILCVGPIWRGSNAGGLFRALSREGCLVDVVDEFYYISFHATDITTKVIQKAIRYLQIREFNKAIVTSIDLFKPDVLLVYKGRFVLPSTLEYAKKKGHKLALFYPDVSMKAHGKYIPLDIPYYDIVFTTKTFGIKDLKEAFGVNNAIFIPHGFDPEIHRKLHVSEGNRKIFGCDASFIGVYSPKKEQLLAKIKEKLPNINMKIWGPQWEKATSQAIKTSIQNLAVFGDMYALAIQCSKINMGILNEQVVGASSGDLITSRTFHIPGSFGFMLHEKNEESLQYFTEDKEAGFFAGVDDIAEKVDFFLANERIRETIKLAGYERARSDHSLDNRARLIIRHLAN